MALSRAQIAKAVKTAFKEVGDVKETVVYNSVVTSGHDPVTDQEVSVTTPYTIRVIDSKFSDAEQDYFPAGVITKKLLIQASDMPGVRPMEADYVTLDAQRWEVRRMKGVPGDSLWIVFIQLV